MKNIIFLILPLFCFSQLSKYKDFIPESSTDKIGHNEYYSFSWLPDHQLPEWTIYHSSSNLNLKREVERAWMDFKQNPNYPNYYVDLNAFKYNPYDKSHLVPAAEMAFNQNALIESFYSTNVSPMIDEVNRGIWKKLEYTIRDWVKKKDSLIIISGTILKDSNYFKKLKSYSEIGEFKLKGVSIPEFYYKVVIDVKKMNSIAFVIPNISGLSEDDLTNYVYSVKEVEKLTGINQMKNLPDFLQEKIEAPPVISEWFNIKKSETKKSKYAMVIGNANYDNEKDKLTNPINDAFLMKETFEKMNFDLVLYKNDLNYSDMKSSIIEYLKLKDKYDIGILYYAGHGFQDNEGNPFIMPIDFDYNNLNNSSISIKKIISALGNDYNNNNIIILDACRETSNSIISKPNISEPVSLKLAFSTSYGYLAFDNPELDNSVYTSILSNSFKTKDLTIQQIFQQTWNKVFNKTKQRQSPSQHYGAALNEIILK